MTYLRNTLMLTTFILFAGVITDVIPGLQDAWYGPDDTVNITLVSC